MRVFTGLLLITRHNLDMFTLVCLALWDGVCCMGLVLYCTAHNLTLLLWSVI